MKKRLLIYLMVLCAALTGCGMDKKTSYNKALELFAAGEYDEAATLFERTGAYEKAETYAAYSRGLVYYERGEYERAAPCFEGVQDFMYGRDRYYYCHAYALMSEGDFSGALKLLEALADYEDAPVLAAYCRGREAETVRDYETALYSYAEAEGVSDAAERFKSLREMIYERATELMGAGDYGNALTLFTMLCGNVSVTDMTAKGYLDSAEMARRCKEHFRSGQYAQAEALLASGDTRGAYEAFAALSGYSDAEIRAQELASRLGIPEEVIE